MGDIKGFLKTKRYKAEYRPVCERLKDFKDVSKLRPENVSIEQASRCMDCGTPFCHWGCPLGNYIPEWNDLLFNKHWEKAYNLLQATNNFPEFTGRLCPAICEYSCVLGLNDEPVTIRENELSIIEHAFGKNLVKPKKPKLKTNKKVAIIGSGPSGLACADILNQFGHKVIVFEKQKKLGGILRYGIPDFKLEKWIIDRRINILKQNGITFEVNTTVNNEIVKSFDAVVLCLGCDQPRDLLIEGRELKGIYFAMDYLTQVNKINSKEKFVSEPINANGKKVVVIGGGDTGSDCVGTANRQGAKCVIQIELLEAPPECRTEDQPWPKYPMLLKTTSSHEEGVERKWGILTKKFIGENGKIKKLLCKKVEFHKSSTNTCPTMKEVPNSEFEIEADLVILAMGFIHPKKEGIISQLNLTLDERGNIKTDKNYMTSQNGVFACGDVRRGQSLIVWAIFEGRQAAYSINNYLSSHLRKPALQST